MQNVTVYDSGPREPKKPDEPLIKEHLSNVEQEAARRYEQDRRDYEAWHKANKEPVAITMATVDARAAIAADPERYSYDLIPAHVPNLNLEDRVTLLERRLAEYDLMAADELKAYREKVAAKREEDAKAAAAPPPPSGAPTPPAVPADKTQEQPRQERSQSPVQR